MAIKPQIVLPKWATNTKIIQEPSDTKKEIGWLVAEKPPAHWMNWVLNAICQHLTYVSTKLEEMGVDGIVDPTPIGIVAPFAGDIPPTHWMLCDGSYLQIAQYTKLYNVIGIKYGGDGVTTFKLPDAMGRTLIGAGQGENLTKRVAGEKFGEEKHKLALAELTPHGHSVTDTHSHTITDLGHSHLINDPGHIHKVLQYNKISNGERDNNAQAGDTLNRETYTESAKTGITIKESSSNVSISGKTGSISVNNTGDGQSFNVCQPSLVVNYIIKVD